MIFKHIIIGSYLNLRTSALQRAAATQTGIANVRRCGCQAAVPPGRRRCLVISTAKPWRPSIDDVDSISRGGPANVRGTGSRRIPHRLNAEERTLYDLAKRKSFLSVRGTAYRKFRHGNPLPNIYRQWCDARCQVCVVLEQDPLGAAGADRVVVDLAPLRAQDTSQVEQLLSALAAEAGLRWVPYSERPADALPFNILPPDEEEEEEEKGGEAEGGRERHLRAAGSAAAAAEAEAAAVARVTDGAASSSTRAVSTAAVSGSTELAGLRGAVAAQAEIVRQLKAQGLTNKDAAVQEQVVVLLRLKADLARAEEADGPAAGVARTAASHHNPASAAAARPPLPPSEQRQGQGQRSNTRGCESEPPRSQGQEQAQGQAHPRQDLQLGSTVASAAAAPPRRSPLEHYSRLPIWQIHALPLFFEGPRQAAKVFASQAVQRVNMAAAESRGRGAAVASDAPGSAIAAAAAVAPVTAPAAR